MSSCWCCHFPPRTAGTALGLIINSGRGGGLAEPGWVQARANTVFVCLLSLAQAVCWPASPGLVPLGTRS